MNQSNQTNKTGGVSKLQGLRDVYIVDGARTPFIKAQNKPNPMPAADLAVACAKPLLQRQPFKPSDLDEVIVGCVGPSVDEANIGRIVALRLGCGKKVHGWTVQRNCASGMQSIDSAAKDIAIGRHDLVLAGGAEAMSRAPLLYNDDMVNWFAGLNSAKTLPLKLQQLIKFRPRFLKPVIAILRGLTDPTCDMNMGQTAEKVAHQFGITREEMDEFSVRSHKLAMRGYENNHFEEVVPLFDFKGKVIERDNGIREDSSVEKLAKLKPVFEKPFGKVTPGNSSQITDGAAFVILASKEAVDKYNLHVMGKIKDIGWAGVDPTVMGLGPANVIADILMQNNLKLNDIDYYEINEAFAGQVIGCVRALNDEKYCKEEFGTEPFGEISLDKLNVDGGAIALGHPVGASGARITLHMLHTLKRNNAKRGIATLCIGGGQGGAVLLETV